MIGVVTGIMMLVRTGSKGPALVDGLGSAWIHAAQATVGYGNGSVARPVPRPGRKDSGDSGDSGSGPSSGIPLFPGLPNIPGFPTLPNPLDPSNWPDLNPFG